jgi:hypothetical protein
MNAVMDLCVLAPWSQSVSQHVLGETFNHRGYFASSKVKVWLCVMNLKNERKGHDLIQDTACLSVYQSVYPGISLEGLWMTRRNSKDA